MTTTAPRREQLLVAAADLFAKHGFHAVGIDDIGAAAGITGPAVYRHFPSKQAILVAVCSRTMDRMLGLAHAAHTVEELVEVHVRFAVEDRDALGVWVRERHALEPAVRKALRAQQNEYVGIWQAALSKLRPDLREEEVDLRTRTVLAMLNATSLVHSRLSRAERSDVLARMAMSALLD